MKFDFLPGYPDALHRLEDIKKIVGGKILVDDRDLIFIYSIIQSKKPGYVLEIGRNIGMSTSLIAGALTDVGSGRLISIDIADLLNSQVKELIRNNTLALIDNSRNLLINEVIRDLKFDVFFIDGDHSRNMVYQDIVSCYSLSNPGAVFLCHDNDLPGTLAGIAAAAADVNLIDCGSFGKSIQMLIRKI